MRRLCYGHWNRFGIPVYSLQTSQMEYYREFLSQESLIMAFTSYDHVHTIRLLLLTTGFGLPLSMLTFPHFLFSRPFLPSRAALRRLPGSGSSRIPPNSTPG